MLILESLKNPIIPCLVILLCSDAVILRFAPLQNKRHPLSKNAYIKAVSFSRLLILCVNVLFFSLWYFRAATFSLCIISITTAAVALLIMYAIVFVERRERK